MSKKSLVLISVVALITVLSVSFIFAGSARSKSAQPNSASLSATPTAIAGPGRVEPLSEDIKLGSELSGKLKAVYVEEGDSIRRGQVLAELENADYQAQVLSAEADVQAKEAALRKVINGARSQERAQALSTARGAAAVLENARSEMQRRQKLFAAGVISKEELERAQREFDVAKANYDEAIEHHALIDDKAREEDRSSAEAELQLAKAQLQEARARYAKTFIRSPIDGTVLRKHHRNGESVSNSSTAPDPILTVGDEKILRVRVDVDETDVAKVHTGQKAYVTADAFGDRKFWGRVVRVGQQLGPKNVRTDEPTEHVDTKILETLVQLDQGADLPTGLRVDAYILP